ncbi:MAG: sugar phosphate isomerase/epimerase family protein [Planctomycetota bacterium]
MQLGFVSAILPEMNLSGLFKVASDIGYDCVEVMCWPVGKSDRRYAGVTHIDARNLTEESIDQIKHLQSEAGVSISGLGYYPNALSPDPAESETASEHLVAVIDAAARLGIGVVNTFIGRDWSQTVDANWPRFLSVWEPIIRHAEEKRVRIGIENCPMLFTDDEWPGGKNLAHSPAIWSRMFESIPSDCFGLNYDPSHMVFQQMDYVAPLREFSDKLFHVHAKDVRVDVAALNRVGVLSNPNLWHSPKLPGLGDVDWGRFFSALTDTGYSGPVCVEVEDRAYEGSENDVMRSLTQSERYLRGYVC